MLLTPAPNPSVYDEEYRYWCICVVSMSRGEKIFLREGEEIVAKNKKKVKRFIESTVEKYLTMPFNETKQYSLVVYED